MKKTISSDKLIANLYKCAELLEVCYTLKFAYYKQKYSDLSDSDIKNKIYSEAIERKEQQWTLQKI